MPFNLTLLTVDTHYEDGYVCRLCDDTFGDDQYANVMACSSKQIGAFLKWIREQDFYDNTKDAGEVGAGHSVTALYEVELTETGSSYRGVSLEFASEHTSEPAEDNGRN